MDKPELVYTAAFCCNQTFLSSFYLNTTDFAAQRNLFYAHLNTCGYKTRITSRPSNTFLTIFVHRIQLSLSTSLNSVFIFRYSIFLLFSLLTFRSQPTSRINMRFISTLSCVISVSHQSISWLLNLSHKASHIAWVLLDWSHPLVRIPVSLLSWYRPLEDERWVSPVQSLLSALSIVFRIFCPKTATVDTLPLRLLSFWCDSAVLDFFA